MTGKTQPSPSAPRRRRAPRALARRRTAMRHYPAALQVVAANIDALLTLRNAAC
jgi:hypothetical protein